MHLRLCRSVSLSLSLSLSGWCPFSLYLSFSLALSLSLSLSVSLSLFLSLTLFRKLSTWVLPFIFCLFYSGVCEIKYHFEILWRRVVNPFPRSVKVESKCGNWRNTQMVLFFTRLPAPGILFSTLTDRGEGVTAPLTYIWKWYFISQTPDPRKSELSRFRFYFLATSESLSQCIRVAWPWVLQANVQSTAPRPARPYMQPHVKGK